MTGQARTATRYIVVADVVGSTRIYDLLGDTRGKAFVTRTLQGLARIIAGYNGTIVATVGDELVAAFSSAGEAAATACEMHLAVRAEPDETQGVGMSLRVGIHGGNVQVEPFELMSETVAISRHVSRLAKAEQTLVTGIVHEQLPGIYRALTRYVDREPWRGMTTTQIDLHELVWEVEGLTAHASGPPVPTQARVVLTLGATEYVVDERKPVLTAGRAPLNDIVSDFDLVSREHFTITLRGGRCTLADSSTNGTFVVADDGTQTEVLRESRPLKGSGRIWFGRPSPENADYAIRFRCE